ncbi:hypothetical protein ACF1BE_10845 [Streptomyces sp. NPDC014991]|uniref:hypothetical protein n=1 Tax=Streptomyces sp. NPDC014991 TaxID=3364935 RepID=UPI0036FE30F1
MSIENDAPDFRERVNHEWYMLGAHQGLFITSKPQFLIAVRDVENDRPDMAWWARVQLQTDWDFAGSGAEAGVTGYSWGRPEFIMLSLNGNVVVQGSQGQKWTDIVCLRDAYHITPLREMGMKLSEDASIPEETRGALSRWLEHTAAR